MHVTFLGPLGRGGFGVVTKVVDDYGNVFARKTFTPGSQWADDPKETEQLRKRFIREVRIQQQLGGREIIPVLHAELEGSSPWFLMPLAEKTYEVQIEEDRKTGQINGKAIADILNGLLVLHDKDFTHRDLNPRNILLHEGHWKLSDFGAALPPSGQTVTMTEDTVIFTEKYCSPEQRRDFHSARPSADIYSFGCILHDIFGQGQRNPYGHHTASGPMGVVIEKCTHPTPTKRPNIRTLQSLVLDVIVGLGGQCRVSDVQSENWLKKLETITNWNEEEVESFARFFGDLNTEERIAGRENEWVDSRTTPFLTHVPAAVLSHLASRGDGVAQAIIEKYCDWAQSTRFLFEFSDSVCVRLAAIADHGTASMRAMAILSMLSIGASHNRWFIMREGLRRCLRGQIDQSLAQRLEIEIRASELEPALRHCVSGVKWDIGTLAPEIRALADGV